MLRRVRFGYLLMVVLTLLTVQSAVGDNVYARIRGVVTDPQGAAVAGAKLIANNTLTGFERPAVSDSSGAYEFLDLPIGDYKVTATAPGFRKFETSTITLTVNQVYSLPIQLVVGSVNETVEVQAAAVQVETTNTQLQTLVGAKQIVDLPLLGRNWTQLEQLAPGVMASSDRFGTFSANGSQSNQSSYLVNGMDTNDIALNQPLIIPSPDAIAEFNLITNTINPEYGRNSGAIVNAVIKSGTNQFHGEAHYFYRDTFLNDRDFLELTKPTFHQNLFGGTFGGPVVKDKTFFFASFEGLKNVAPQVFIEPTVFTQDQRNGMFFSGAAPPSSNPSPIALTGSDGTVYPAGTPYTTIFGGSGGLVCGPNGTTACVVGQIPLKDYNPVALALMNKYVPLPNSGTSTYSFNPSVKGLSDQGLGRIDHTIGPKDQIWGVIFFQHGLNQTSTLPFLGATLPGFGEIDNGESKNFIADWTHTFNATTLNEFRVGFTRLNFVSVNPENVVQPGSAGFTGINSEFPAGAGLPLVSLAGFFNLGFSEDGPQPRKDQNYEITDNFSKIIGKHSLKFGFDGRRINEWDPFKFENNGVISFGGVGANSTGNPGADFLLGFPDSYAENSGGLNIAYAYNAYAYVQDSWRFRSNLTLNFGTGWDVETPWSITQFHGLDAGCFRLGEQSTVFPTAPVGLVFPGDPGCNTASGITTKWKHFAPRFGFAWAPNFGRWGSNGKLSIRGGVGVYYNRTEEEGALQNITVPPFTLNYLAANQCFINPFLLNDCKTPIGGGVQLFPFSVPAVPNFAEFEPISVNFWDPHYTVPYAINFNLTLQRELPGRTVLTVGYVGSLGRHEQRAYENNLVTAASQAACLNGTAPLQAAPFSFPVPPCAADAAFREDYVVTQIQPGSIWASQGTQHTDGNSYYNALQVSANKALSHGLSFQASYTWSHSIDNGSGFEETTGGGAYPPRGVTPPGDPVLGGFSPAVLDKGDSAFDARNRFVIGYNYTIPDLHQKINALPSAIFKGWQLTGITTFQSGFPIDISDNLPRSLTCDEFSYYSCPEGALQTGSVTLLNPRDNANNYYFCPVTGTPGSPCATGPFSVATLGTYGNVRRNSIHGPNYRNTDFIIMKNTYLTKGESPKYLQLRLEGYNIFNRTNFCQGTTAGANLVNPTTCIGTNVFAANFGEVLAAAAGRQVQLGAKFFF